MTPVVRPIANSDWPRILTLEAEAYREKGLSESPAALRSRARASRATSFVLDVSGEVNGYLLALPYPLFRFPDLSRPELAVHESANLHLHDLVVDGRHRRTRLGALLLRHLLTVASARNFERISLVSVAGSGGFWAAQGFRPYLEITLSPDYGPDAAYMSRPTDREN